MPPHVVHGSRLDIAAVWLIIKIARWMVAGQWRDNRMNRLGIFLAAICGMLALLAAAFAGADGSHRNAPLNLTAAAAPLPTPKITAASKPTTDDADPKDADSKDSDDDDAVIRFVKNPEPLPPFLARDLDGQIVSTAALKGKVVLVNFWATWCPPCREEIPELVKLQTTYKDQLQIIGVSEDEDVAPEAVREFARGMHVNYPIVIVSRELEKEFGGIPALPTSFMVNKEGGVVQKHVGLFPGEVYDREIRALLGMQVSEKIETFDDLGQIFLKNAEHATDLPGVDFSGLSPEQKQAALKRMNTDTCTCGCRMTLAQCRINDSACETSRSLTAKIVKQIAGKEAKPVPSAPAPSGSTTE
jgi:thiol-disulfide isomerase/thioredoxin